MPFRMLGASGLGTMIKVIVALAACTTLCDTDLCFHLLPDSGSGPLSNSSIFHHLHGRMRGSSGTIPVAWSPGSGRLERALIVLYMDTKAWNALQSLIRAVGASKAGREGYYYSKCLVLWTGPFGRALRAL